MKKLAIAHVEDNVSQLIDIFSDGEMVATEKFSHARQRWVIELKAANPPSGMKNPILIRFQQGENSNGQWSLDRRFIFTENDFRFYEEINSFLSQIDRRFLSWTQVAVSLALLSSAMDGHIHGPLTWEHISQVKESQYVPTPCGSFEVPIMSTIHGEGSSLYHDGVNWIER